MGRGAVQATPGDARVRPADDRLPAARRARRAHVAVRVQACPDASPDRPPVRGIHEVSADSHRRPSTARRS